MATFSHLGVSQPSTIALKVASVTVTRNSTAKHQELLTLADAEDSVGLARVLAAPMASTAYGLGVRIISGPSSAADLSVTIANPTVTVGVSSIAGRSLVDQNSTVWPVQIPSSQSVQVKNSTIGDLLASVQQNSTVWQVQCAQISSLSTGHVTVDTGSMTLASIAAAAGRIPIGSTATENVVLAQLHDSTGNAIISSTSAASTATAGARGLLVRHPIPDCTSATVRLATAGDNAILSSAATTIHVYAVTFSWGQPSTGTSTGSSGGLVQIQAGTTGARLWSFNFQPSSLGSGHNSLAVTPPAYLFRTGASASLNAATVSSGGYISVAAWRE